ncbi:MAG: LuxR C-terminal-related transcriptional regulator [Flavobacteriales bacterium]|jgi:DNA-binding NarL/FixJ family response regulator|nr:LuxR C-terminal-related transcriptional regulator [Flavobacteriales bacterium]
MERNLRILVVEDDPLIAADICGYLHEQGHRTVGPVADRTAAQELVARMRPDAAILDINLGGEENAGCSLARWLRDHHPVPFIYLTSYADERTLAEARATHPGGYLLKPFTGADIKVALDVAVGNWHDADGPRAMAFDPAAVDRHLPEPLSGRERDVARHLCEGLGNKAIGERLFLSEHTVKSHLRRLFSKLDVAHRTAAVHRLRTLSLKRIHPNG